MPGVRHNFCFDYAEGECLPRFFHGRDGLKNILKWFLKKNEHPCLVKNMQKWDKNIYDVDKKSESSFETCCLLIF